MIIWQTAAVANLGLVYNFFKVGAWTIINIHFKGIAPQPSFDLDYSLNVFQMFSIEDIQIVVNGI